MKKIVFFIVVLMSNLVLAQNTDKNYVKTTTYQVSVKNQSNIDALSDYDKQESITYYDGLGRPEQTVALRSGGVGSVVGVNGLTYDWSLGDFTTSFFSKLGTDSENLIVEGETPFGNTDLLWQCGSDAESDADGGWNTAWQGVDNTKKYRYSVWVKRTGDVSNGRAYQGTKNVNNLDGSSNSNPYFFGSYLPEADTWYLMIGVIHPHNYVGGDTGESGIYNTQGVKVLDGAEFKWDVNTTSSRFRSYLYYCTDTSAKQYFWNPLLQEFNGTEYTLSEVQNLQDVQQSGVSKDMVTPIVYDDFGRQVKDYLPTPIEGTNGYYIPTDIVISTTEDYYLNKFSDDLNSLIPNVYSKKHLESSPLNRLLEQAAPGEDWMLDEENDTDHTIKFDYQSNTATEVRYFTVDFIANDTEQPSLVYVSDYQANELYKTITKDENWKPNQTFDKDHTTEEFKNKQGQIVLKRAYESSTGAGLEAHDTYYVYDDYGNLTYVISPEGSHAIATANNVITQSVLDNLCYQYKYDYRNRLVEKKVPGKGWEYIVYDRLDRPVLTQDAIQASKNPKEWLFTKYDVFGRVVYTGLYTDSSNSGRETIQSNVTLHSDNAPKKLYETRQLTSISQDPTTVLYYTSRAYPSNPSKIYTINYYDDYDWDTCANLEASYNFTTSAGLSNSETTYTKTDTALSWNVGFVSNEAITGDGYISFTATQLNKRVYVGLTQESSVDQNNHNSTIDYAVYLGYLNNRVIIFESGVQQPMVTTYYEVGDEFKVERVGDQIVYKQNNEIFHISSSVAPTGSLIGDASFYDPGTTVDNVLIGHSYNGQPFALQTKTLATGSKVRVLGTDQWICNTAYYDKKGRNIYNVSTNEYLDTYDTVGTQLDFVGKVITSKQTHRRAGDSPIVTKDVFTYDHTGRLLRQEQQVNNFNKELLVKNTYDDLGQLIKKQVGGKLSISNSYDYDNTLTEVDGNTIKKIGTTNGWNAGLSTLETISGDGYLSYTVLQHSNYKIIGLTYADVDEGYANIDYALYHTAGFVRVLEHGNGLGIKTTYVANDKFKIERRGHTIYYLKNDKVFYISQVPTVSAPLKGDLSLFHTNTEIRDLEIVDLETGLQDVDYEYNIRGWLTQINDVDNLSTTGDLFGFKINYNTVEGAGNVDPLYNGNISQTIWQTASVDPNQVNKKRGYSYRYDALNRIKDGKLYKGSNLTTLDKYGLNNVSYDFNGNILSLNREDQNGLMDQLTYTYNGNQLEKVADAVTNVTNQGFIDGNNTNNDYIYDINGNMIADANKKITSISYNHLNLPKSISFDFSNSEFNLQGQIVYVYDATGTKLSKMVTTSGPAVRVAPELTLYAGDYIYKGSLIENVTLQFINQAEGYIEPTITSGNRGKSINKIDYIYQYKDHLGNIRLSYSDSDGNNDVTSSEIIEENNYYPFGLKHKGYNNVVSPNVNSVARRFKYNGKELNEELGLNMYDYGARFYDPALGRWFTPDALAEKYYDQSIYTYALNNPIIYIDPDGNQVEMCCDGLKAFVYTIVDNNFGTNYRNENDTGTQEYRNGVIAGHSTTLAGGVILEMNGAQNMIAGGSGLLLSGAAASTGVGAPAGAVGATTSGGLLAVGAIETAAGYNMVSKTVDNMRADANNGNSSSSSRTTDDSLRRDNNGNPKPDPEAEGTSHTQLGTKEGRNGNYKQAREFDSNNKPVRDVDFTDHGRPNEHSNPHQHKYNESQTGGTRQRGKAEPLENN